MKKLIALLLASALLIATLAGCQSQAPAADTPSAPAQDPSTTQPSGDEPAAAREHVTLEFIFPQNNPTNDWDLIMAEFEARTKDTLNVSLNVTHTGFDDIGQKVSLKLTSGQAIDSVFVAQWTSPSMQEMALKGQLINLDSYFNNDAYPGLKRAFGADYLSQNSFIGDDGQYHVYAIPFAHEYGAVGSFVYYRQDLADKYGLGQLNDINDLTAYFDAILANEPGMIPYVSLGMDGFQAIAGYSAWDRPVETRHNYGEVNGVNYVIKDDGTAYFARSAVAVLDPEYVANLPAEAYNADNLLYDYYAARSWYEKGYVSKDVMNITDHQGMFCNGKAAAFSRGIDTYSGIASQLQAGVPGAALGVVNVLPNKDAEVQAGCTFQAWNFAAIPATCKNVDRVMEFYDWLFADDANHDLFEYGIEGKHWVDAGEGKYTPQTNPDTGKEYNFDAYVMTWNPGIRRFDTSSPDFIIEELVKGGDEKYFYKQAHAGFSFNTEEIKSVDAKVTEVLSGMNGLKNGSVKDIEGEIDKINQRLQSVGFEEWVTELERQFNDYLKEHPYEGQ